MFCTNCGDPVVEGQAFCAKCGHPVGTSAAQGAQANASASTSPPATGPAPRSGAVPGRDLRVPILAGVAAVLAVLVVAVGIRAFLAGGSATDGGNEQVATQSKDEQGDTTHEDAPETSKTSEPTLEQRAASAYDTALDKADSYMAEEWYGQYPDSSITYTLMELSGDDLPELVLMAHYSNVGTHTSGGQRLLPLVYDEEANDVVAAQSDEYAIFWEPWTDLTYDANQHAIRAESRYFRGQETAWFREHVEGTSLVREEVGENDLVAGDFPHDFVDPGNRSLIDELRGGTAEG